jgi:flagellar protein FliO/FliZ
VRRTGSGENSWSGCRPGFARGRTTSVSAAPSAAALPILEYPRGAIGDCAKLPSRTLKPERRATDVVIALLSRRLPPVRTSILLIAAACAAIALLHPAPASAAAGATKTAAKTAAAGRSTAKARKKAPAFHEDRTPLNPDVASAGTSKGGKAPSVGGAGADVIRTIVGLAVVLGVIYGVYWLLKSSARAKAGRGDERIGVIATTPLAPNRSLHLVRAGDELILVGATDQSITPLRVYTADEAILVEGGAADVPLQLPAATPSGRESFLEILRKRTARA